MRCALAALLPAVVACGAPAAGAPVAEPDAYRGRAVRDIDIVGNRAVPDEDIEARIATREPGAAYLDVWGFDPFAMRIDEQRVLAVYRRRGYFAARVAGVEVVPAGAHAVDVRIRVDEGPATRIGEVRVRGVGALDVGGILDELDLERGAVFEHGRYQDSKVRIQRRLVAAGYAHASVEGAVQVDLARHTADIELVADPGPLVRFGPTEIAGAADVPLASIRARITYREGERFDPRAIETTRQRLFELDVFSAVRVDYPREGRPEVARMLIELGSAARRELKLGGGIGVDNSRFDVRGRAEYRIRGVLDPLTTARFASTVGYPVVVPETEEQEPVGEVLAGLDRTDVWVSRLRAAGLAAFESTLYAAYTLRGARLELGLDRPFLTDRLRAGVGWRVGVAAVDVADRVLAAQLPDFGRYRLGYYRASLAYDGRDDRLSPRLGVYAEARVELGGAYAGGAFDYQRYLGELRGYLPVGERVVLAARARAGTLADSGTAEEPITQRFYAGGSSSHRGFGFRRLSPALRDSEGEFVPVGGDTLVESSVEARIGLARLGGSWLSLGAFADAGDVTASSSALDPTQLHWAAGLGVRYATPIGPARIDVARRLNRLEVDGPGGTLNPDPGAAWVFHLSIGEAF